MNQNQMSKGHKMIYHWEIQGRKCYYCGVDLFVQAADGTIEIVDCNLDHKVPQSKGGSDSVINTCLSCLSCNSHKGSMWEDDFKKLMELVRSGKLKKKDFTEFQKYLELKKKYMELEAEPVFPSETEPEKPRKVPVVSDKVVINDRVPLSGLEAEFNKL